MQNDITFEDWFYISRLKSLIFRYMSMEDVGYSYTTAIDGRKNYGSAPSIIEIFEKALASEKIDKELKMQIVFALGNIKDYDGISKNSKRRQ